MKKIFPEFYRPSFAEFKKLWEECIFIPDANVLLNIYGYSEKTRKEILSLFGRLASRLRIPHQFAYEYQKNRAHAIMEQVKNYAKAEKVLETLYKSELLPKNRHPFLSDRMLTSFNKVRQTLAKSRKQHEALLSKDPYFEKLSEICKIVGDPFTDLDKIYSLCRKRYSEKKPPGYADAKEKAEIDSFGDCIGWMQVIELSKQEKKPVILVTDDAKEDWWQIQSDRTIGPRPELICEFHAECAQGFYMYSSAQFLIHANTYLRQNVKRVAIKEIEERNREQLFTASIKKTASTNALEMNEVAKVFVAADRPKAAPVKALVAFDKPKSSSNLDN